MTLPQWVTIFPAKEKEKQGKPKSKISFKVILIFLAILTVSIFLRLWNLKDGVFFYGDEGISMQIAWSAINGQPAY